MRWLGQKPILHHSDTEFHGLASTAVTTLGFINDHGIQETTTTDGFHDGIANEGFQSRAELLTTGVGILTQLLIPQDFQGGSCHLAGQRITTISGSMFTRVEGQHDFVTGQDGRDGQDTAREGLPQDNNIWFAVIVMDGQLVSSSTQTSLHFISNQQNIVLGTQCLGLGQVPIIGHYDTSFSLNGFHHESGNISTILLQFHLQGSQIIVRHGIKSRHVRSKSPKGRWIVRRRHGRQGATPKVVIGKEDLGLIGSNALDFVSPFACQLDGRFATLHASIHGKHAIVSKVLCHEFRVRAQGVIVKGAGCERQRFSLFRQGGNDFGVAVALIDSRIGG
mmetsp:Transcript_21210/g.35104  ORF Transcript_21210/g.35104 Transcript_21210/m.35104 type:complete len:335 (+) Transcript_21210:255-1259(+)